MPKDPDIKSNSSKPTKTKTTKNSKLPAKGTAKQLSFKEKLDKFGIKKETHKKTIIKVGIGVLVALVIIVAVFGVLVYKYKSTNRAVKIASKIVAFPVASVNGNILWNTVTYNEYLFELYSIQKYLQSQDLDLNSEEGKQKIAQLKKEIITQLENNQIISQQANKYGIKVTDKDIQEQYNELEKEAGGKEKVTSTLDKLYGWTVNDFKDKIRQSILQQKLGEKILADDSLNEPAKKQIDEIKKQIDAGGDFAELAKKNSSDGSASNGGDLGLVSKGQTVPEFEAAAFALEPGQVSGVVKTKFGYHIIKVTGKEGDQVRISHILIKGVDIESWLREQRSKSKIVQYFTP